MIKIKQLIYCYENLKMEFNFTIDQGEKVAIFGGSGAGKSTLLNLIAGFKFSKKGEIWLNKKNCTYIPPEIRPVSIIFQDNNLFAHLTVWQNIALGISPNLYLNQTQHDIVNKIIKKVSLENCLTRLPGQISGGQRQRTALARCLIRQKPILLLDEPFSALDPALRNDMLVLLKKICDEKELTLLMVSHNLEDAIKITTRCIIISKGKIIYDGHHKDQIKNKNML
ncbi:MAG: thiamine ABC transporter ATP-binding protein ThiQ [Arsenophonus sp.]|nr:MAG: thiamine ABC transporter ATP-binding protein ThiQ [Arsenophonus sp.]